MTTQDPVDLEALRGFTPGPWEDLGPNQDGERCIFGADDSSVAVTIPAGTPDSRPDRSIANARLLVAAPSMHAELTARRALDAEVETALRAAEQFIVNGIEYGYIAMPAPNLPDPAHGTLPAIRAALATFAGAKP